MRKSEFKMGSEHISHCSSIHCHNQCTQIDSTLSGTDTSHQGVSCWDSLAVGVASPTSHCSFSPHKSAFSKEKVSASDISISTWWPQMKHKQWCRVSVVPESAAGKCSHQDGCTRSCSVLVLVGHVGCLTWHSRCVFAFCFVCFFFSFSLGQSVGLGLKLEAKLLK